MTWGTCPHFNTIMFESRKKATVQYHIYWVMEEGREMNGQISKYAFVSVKTINGFCSFILFYIFLLLNYEHTRVCCCSYYKNNYVLMNK